MAQVVSWFNSKKPSLEKIPRSKIKRYGKEALGGES
jgi:hypothetical protein